MTRYELTFICRNCDEEVEPIKHNESFLLPPGLHECIDLEESTVAEITATGIEVLAEDELKIDVGAHTIYPPDYEEHTLQWAETEDGKIAGIHIITERDISAAATAGRAQIKMVTGECREVSGSKQVIEELREKLDEFVVEDSK